MKFFLPLLILFMGTTDPAFADTTIENIQIEYVHEIYAGPPNANLERMAAVGGKVDFSGGPGPVHVTLTNGGQHYTTLTDLEGHYSFLIWVHGSDLETQAWTTPTPTNRTAGTKLIRARVRLKKQKSRE